ncbi:MAG: cyclase/dehydrase [Deltaproteobacteria bacterium]|nr:cyclase/dehydrase [Deltaproteobacteria bacterium]
MLTLLLLLSLAPPEGGWQEAAKVDGIVIYNRTRAGSDVKEVLAIGTFDAAPAHVHRVLDDNARYQDFMPYTKVSRVLKRDGDTVWSYERINAPLVAERDYVVKITHRAETRADGAVVLQHAFTQSNADGPAPVDGVVRVAVLDGRWQLEPIDGGKRTRATYWVYTSPGGSVPTFLVNAANTNAVPGLFDAVKKALPSH